MANKPRYYIYSGPDYIDFGRKFDSLEEAKIDAEKRSYWKFIYNQARIIQLVNPKFVTFCEQINHVPPKEGMIWMGTPAYKLQT